MRRTFLSSNTGRPRSGGGWYIPHCRNPSAAWGKLGRILLPAGVEVKRNGKVPMASRGFPWSHSLSGNVRWLPVSVCNRRRLAGGQATDFVLLVMNNRGANGILSSKVKLGADASVAAGPVGRNASAETDVSMRAEILSYSRARGLFAGISLEGSTIRPDNDANKRIYG